MSFIISYCWKQLCLVWGWTAQCEMFTKSIWFLLKRETTNLPLFTDRWRCLHERQKWQSKIPKCDLFHEGVRVDSRPGCMTYLQVLIPGLNHVIVRGLPSLRVNTNGFETSIRSTLHWLSNDIVRNQHIVERRKLEDIVLCQVNNKVKNHTL